MRKSRSERCRDRLLELCDALPESGSRPGGEHGRHVAYVVRARTFAYFTDDITETGALPSQGDYPNVCARSGLPADKFVPVEAARRAVWPWWFVPMHAVTWHVAWRSVDKDHLWWLLPFATGDVKGVTATWDRREGVVILRATSEQVE